MRQENVQFFTEKEEEFASLLIGIGMQKTVATVLVFLISVPEATSREIERGTDLRQPEVSIAAKYLAEQGWITVEEIASRGKGRRVKKYSLGMPAREIMAALEKAKKDEVKAQLVRIRKMKDYL